MQCGLDYNNYVPIWFDSICDILVTADFFGPNGNLRRHINILLLSTPNLGIGNEHYSCNRGAPGDISVGLAIMFADRKNSEFLMYLYSSSQPVSSSCSFASWKGEDEKRRRRRNEKEAEEENKECPQEFMSLEVDRSVLLAHDIVVEKSEDALGSRLKTILVKNWLKWLGSVVWSSLVGGLTGWCILLRKQTNAVWVTLNNKYRPHDPIYAH